MVSILGVLTDAEQNIWIQPFFIDNTMTSKVRDKVRNVAELRLEDNKPLRDKLGGILSAVETVTNERNKILHGQWRIDKSGRSLTKLWNFKLKKKKIKGDAYYWEHLHETAITPTKVKQLIRESQKLANSLETLKGEMEKFLKAQDERMEK